MEAFFEWFRWLYEETGVNLMSRKPDKGLNESAVSAVALFGGYRFPNEFVQ